jgi:hypothetical protein
MKLAIAAACLVASLSLATHALADGRTVATLQQPVAAPSEFVANGAVWHCAASTCVAGTTPDETFGASQCRDVAKHAGPVAEFKNEYNKTLQPASLQTCNAGLAPKGAVTASR